MDIEKIWQIRELMATGSLTDCQLSYLWDAAVIGDLVVTWESGGNEDNKILSCVFIDENAAAKCPFCQWQGCNRDCGERRGDVNNVYAFPAYRAARGLGRVPMVRFTVFKERCYIYDCPFCGTVITSVAIGGYHKLCGAEGVVCTKQFWDERWLKRPRRNKRPAHYCPY